MAPCLYGREQIGHCGLQPRAAGLVFSLQLNLLKLLLLLGRFARLSGGKPAGEPFRLLGEADPIVGDFQECFPDERIGRLGRALARFDAATPISLCLREHLDHPQPDASRR